MQGMTTQIPAILQSHLFDAVIFTAYHIHPKNQKVSRGVMISHRTGLSNSTLVQVLSKRQSRRSLLPLTTPTAQVP